jgi:membrane dipeptidase
MNKGMSSAASLRPLIVLLAAVGLLISGGAAAGPDTLLLQRARSLAQRFILVDTHIDAPYRFLDSVGTIDSRTGHGDFDYDRAREGGLDVPFMSIYTPSELEGTGRSSKLADSLIDAVYRLARLRPAKFAVVTSPEQIVRDAGKGRILMAMGMENGSPIEGDLKNVQRYFDRGIRYITLAHAKCNHIADGSYDTVRLWKGLSPFGRRVVAEMNRVGIMIDVSHLTDSAIVQTLRITAAPVIASHSSCRYFTPGFERNLSDELIRAIAAGGGVVQINFGASFIDNDFRLQEDRERRDIDAHLASQHWAPSTREAEAYRDQYRHSHPLRFPGVAAVADHIDHIRTLVGVDYVGIGSDFDGVGDTLPVGLKDVSQYPNLLAELLRRGYSDDDVRKICGANLLRVWSKVEEIARAGGVRR